MLNVVSEYWLTWIGVAAAVALVWLVAVLSKYVRLLLNIVRERPGIPGVGALDATRAQGEEVTFRALDGTRLRGMLVRQCAGAGGGQEGSSGTGSGDWLDGQTRGVIIYCHEYGSDMHGCVRYCQGLLEAGFAVFTFDFRGHGHSANRSCYLPRFWCTDKEVSDCLGAVVFVRAQIESGDLDLNIGLLGLSRGACAAVLTAAQADPEANIKAVLADGAFSTDTTLEWSMKRWVSVFAKVRFVYENHRPWFWCFLRWLVLRCATVCFKCRFPLVRKQVGSLPGTAVWFVHGQRDSFIGFDQAERLFSLAKPPRYLWIVPAARHNQSVSSAPEVYAVRALAFFGKYVAGACQAELGIPEAYEKDVSDFFNLTDAVLTARPEVQQYEYVGKNNRLLRGPTGSLETEAVPKTAQSLPADAGWSAR